MKPTLTYSDLTNQRPDKDTQSRIQAAYAERNAGHLREKLEAVRAQRASYEPFRQAQVKVYQQQGVTDALLNGNPFRPLKAIRSPSPRLGVRIVTHGSITVVEVPPFASWIDPQSVNEPANSGWSSGTAYDDQIDLNVSAPSGGVATGWGLIGQYYTVPAAEVPYFLQVNATPNINYSYNWGINGFNTAQLTLQVMICIQLYDSGWNPIRNGVIDFDTYTMANVNTSWPGNQPPSSYGVFGTANPGLMAQMPIIAIGGPQNIGIFVQLYAFGEGGGGSWSSGEMNCTLNQFEFKLQ